MTTQDNPVFYIVKEKPIKAGGVILYRFKGTNIELLLSESNGIFEDLGGCTDKKDKNIYETVAREAYEESNKKIKKSTMLTRLKDAKFAYTPRSKYVIFLVEANEKEEKLKSADFGSKEIHDDIKRTIKWIKYNDLALNEIINTKLNFRLKNRDLYAKIKSIVTDKKNSISMFSESSRSATYSSSDSENEKIVKPKKKINK